MAAASASTVDSAAAGVFGGGIVVSDDQLSQIVGYLPATDAIHLGRTSHRWRKEMQQDRLWQVLCLSHFPSTAKLKGVDNFQQLYRQLAFPHLRSLPPSLAEYQFLVRLVRCAKVQVRCTIAKVNSPDPAPNSIE